MISDLFADTVVIFQITRLQLFEMISDLFADTVVICHHEKLFMKMNTVYNSK